jgi:hypothetical protein
MTQTPTYPPENMPHDYGNDYRAKDVLSRINKKANPTNPELEKQLFDITGSDIGGTMFDDILALLEKEACMTPQSTNPELDDIFEDLVIGHNFQYAKAALTALIKKEALKARIDIVRKLRKEQADFLKAQSGHTRNNNRWPNTRGAGEATKNVLAWLDRHIADLEKQLGSK